MTFSPEDAYANNLPVPDDKDFDTSGLELEPLDGEEASAEVSPATEEVYTKEQQAADAELYKVNQDNSQVELPTISKEEANALRLGAKEQEEIATGEAKAAIMSGDKAAFQEAYKKVTEARIQQAEFQIANLEAGFASGNFQNRGSSEDSEIKDIYEHQVNAQRKVVDSHKAKFESLQSNTPESIAASERWESGLGDTAHTIRGLIDNAESYQKLEADGSEYHPYNGELIGIINASLADKNMSEDVRSALKQAARKVTKLPAELKNRIAKLN